MKMKIVKRRDSGSAQTRASTSRNGRFSAASVPPDGPFAGSTPRSARAAIAKARSETVPDTAIKRSPEKGSRKCPTSGAVMAKPAIIMTQTTVAAAPRRRASTPVARSTRSEVPAAAAPIPTGARTPPPWRTRCRGWT